MNNASVRIDSRRRTVTVGHRSTCLQEKSWQVLHMLVEKAPATVSRKAIIDSVWQGNYHTGEKGLNQALWALRSALGDDSRQPRFIRTIPRSGYQWIQTGTQRSGGNAYSPSWSGKAIVMGSAFVVMTTAIAYLANSPIEPGGDLKSLSAHHAKNAYLRGRDIVVEMSDGCVGIVKISGGKKPGTPVISSDGSQVAFTVHEATNCRLFTVDLKNGERQDFGRCPSEVI